MPRRREPENKERNELISQLIKKYKPQSISDIYIYYKMQWRA